MFRHRHAQIPYVALFLLTLAQGCKNTSVRAPDQPPGDFQVNEISYVESDAFDKIFESGLVRQDPVIVIHTTFKKPEWGPRLNAWIAAWNQGGPSASRTVRGQAPIPSIVVDGDSIREFRLLVNGLMNRVDDLARDGSNWWSEERTRSRRVNLLKPYNLRFHMGDDATIQLVFFNGSYSQYYQAYMQKLTHVDVEVEGWSRTFDCTNCKKRMTVSRRKEVSE
jgi:hypothetical protein